MLKELTATIVPADKAAMDRAQNKWDNVGKPLGALGLLEDDLVRIAGIFGTEDFSIAKKCVVAMCADNGVVEEGVTQCGQEVTAIVAENMARKTSSVCKMAKVAGADVYPVDIGIAVPVNHPNLAQCCVRRGTANMTKGPAMSRTEAEQAIMVGIRMVKELSEQGYKMFATGEMGIGNTTTSAAILSVLLEKEPVMVTGRGAGLSTEGLKRKVDAIERAIALNKPNPSDGVDILAKVGGLDIAGLCGVFLGGAIYHVPVLVDGLISAAAALAAVRICPLCADYILATHVSSEPAAIMALEALESKPLITAGMHLGEGTGAVAAMPLFDMAMVVYNGDTFEDISVDAYTHQN